MATKSPSKNVFRDQWFEMGRPRPLFRLFPVFRTAITFLQQINVKNVHPAYCTVLRTHDLQNMSQLP